MFVLLRPYPASPGSPDLLRAGPGLRGGFSLIELLVVVSVIALLIAILLPSLAHARSQARRTVCTSNLRQIGMGALLYAQEHRSFPPAWVHGTARWMDLLKPYIAKTSGVYLCPEDPLRLAVTWDPTIHLSYGINTFNFSGNATCFWYGVNPAAVKRPSQTILFSDCTPGKYYCGGGSAFAEPVVDVDYRHAGKFFGAVFCDGHAEPLQNTRQSDWDASQ